MANMMPGLDVACYALFTLPGTSSPAPARRPKWPDLVIVLSIVALAATGVAAIWGPTLVEKVRELLGDDRVEVAPPPTIPDKDLL